MIEVRGKSGIRVQVVLHSISEAGKEIITFLRDYPRIVHAEDLKHRMFSNSAASSRAIPFSKMVQQLEGIPARFGKNASGMQDIGVHDANVEGDTWDTTSELDVTEMLSPQEAWYRAREDAIKWSERFNKAGFHKQVSGRLTEPFQMIRVLTTATETANFYWLRDDAAADPTLAEVARCMREAHKQSVPQVLKAGEWHLPFVDYVRDDMERQAFYIRPEQDPLHDDAITIADMILLCESDAIKVSCARCAATSFRNENYGLEKSLQVYDRLVNGDKIHAGALEHCASPMKPAYNEWGVDIVNVPAFPLSWEQGVSHADRQGQLWSGNFAGWVQYRKLIPGENYTSNP